ncbi:MAG: DUF1893 domain-containing protein [Candidatus Fimenecus sp.]
MHPDLESCKAILECENLTCVVKCGAQILKTTDRGIKPFLHWIETGENLQGAIAADKVVGKAAAFLMEKAGLSAVYAAVLSEPAEAVLKNAGIAYTYSHLVPRIQNRAGDGLCPMESAVMEMDNAETAFAALREKLRAFGMQHEL